MIKKLLLGAFIVYNVFAMSAFTVSANTFADKTVISDTKANQKDIPEEVKNSTEDTIKYSSSADVISSTDCNNDIPSITVLSPNGGEIYTAGQQMTVKWNSCNVPLNHNAVIGLLNVDNNTIIYLTNDPNVPTISTPNDGEESFPIPTSAYSGLITGNYKIFLSILSSDNVTDIRDESDASFRINSTIPSITVVSPNGGEFFQAGQQIVVNWTTTNMSPNDQVDIMIAHFSPAGNGLGGSNYTASLTVGGTINDGTETVSLPTQYSGRPLGKYFKIIVVKYPYSGNTSIYDLSDNLFTISNSPIFCDPTSSTNVPAVEVISPNGGEHYLPVEMPVNWRTCLISATTPISIDLIMSIPGGRDMIRHLTTTINDGTQVVSLPNTTSWPQMVYGNNFKVKVYPGPASVSGPSDQSNQNFSIDPAKVTVATSLNTPNAGTVQVSNTSSTNNVDLAKFTVQASNSDLTIKKVPVQITTAGNSVLSVINTIKLYKDSNLIDSIDASSGGVVVGGVTTSSPCAMSTCGFIFNNIYTTVNAGTTAEFTVKVDLKSLYYNYTEGSTIISNISPEDVLTTSNFSVLDTNGDQLGNGQRGGQANGQVQTLRTNTVMVVMDNATVVPTVDLNGNVTDLVYMIPLRVTSIGQTHYIGQTAQLEINPSGTNAFAYAFNVAQNPAFPDTSSIASSALSSYDATIENNGYRLDDSVTKHFTLTVHLSTPSILNSNYRVALQQIRIFDNGALTINPTNIQLLPPYQYQTQFAFINN